MPLDEEIVEFTKLIAVIRIVFDAAKHSLCN